MTATNQNGRHRGDWVLAALERYEGRLTRYATRLMGNDDAARDAVQHTFLRLCDADPAQIDDHLAQWLYLVCRNKAFDALRSSGRIEQLNGSESARLPARESDPAAAAELGDLRVWLRALVSQLAGSQREIIDLWLDGFSYREIAQITGRSDGHVRVLAHRAITQLREHPQTRELLAEQPAMPGRDERLTTKPTNQT